MCFRKFATAEALAKHWDKDHPAPPPALPKTTTKWSVGREVEHFLEGAFALDVGDVFYRVEKLVVKRISKTEGSGSVKVWAEVTKQNWQNDKPQ